MLVGRLVSAKINICLKKNDGEGVCVLFFFGGGGGGGWEGMEGEKKRTLGEENGRGNGRGGEIKMRGRGGGGGGGGGGLGREVGRVKEERGRKF